MRTMLCSTLSMSMTAQGVPYSRAILAARGVVMLLSLRRMGRAKRNPSKLHRRRASDGFRLALPILRTYGSCLLDLLAQHFKLEPAVFSCGEILLRLGDRGRRFLEFLAILGVEIGIVKQPLLLCDIRLQLLDRLRQSFQRVLFVEIEP